MAAHSPAAPRGPLHELRPCPAPIQPAGRNAAPVGERRFLELYRSYAPRVRSYLVSALGECDAEDVAQQVFCAVLSELGKARTEPDNFEHWLFRVTRNHAIDHIRRHRRSSPHESADIDRRREFLARDDQLQALAWGANSRLHGLIEALPPAQRQVIVLHYLGDLTVAEVAAVLGRTSDGIRQLHHRARTTLATGLTAASGPLTEGAT